jgi:hypothetical protein
MASKLRFTKAADNTRPYKSHRYDVFGPKIRRQLFLFGRDAVNAWTLLESDPAVDAYCERPIAIPETKPKRVVDFWVRSNGCDELWFLLRSDECDEPNQDPPVPPAFSTWAKTHGFSIKLINPVAAQRRQIFLDNWGRIIRYIAQNGRYVRPNLLEDVRQSIDGARTLQGIEACLTNDDPTLVRTAAFTLLHSGKLQCRSLDLEPLGPSSTLEVL